MKTFPGLYLIPLSFSMSCDPEIVAEPGGRTLPPKPENTPPRPYNPLISNKNKVWHASCIFIGQEGPTPPGKAIGGRAEKTKDGNKKKDGNNESNTNRG
ncbi:MAG: hypothetical protein IIC06_09420 [Proteobacteria bacterium]|nr:hypothetical protein [Pseudomonadota bacterium]